MFTRILATRTAPLLPDLIMNTQSGFVPGRSIHDTIDLVTLAQKLAKEGEISKEALVLLLDFSKAYDSLDRQFLYQALRWHGFPEPFITTIKALHTGTTARFRANGHLSAKMEVFNGIRQGCPLAPLLFILALDTLFAAIIQSKTTPGITIETRKQIMKIMITGYADDVTLYLNGPQEEKYFLRILRKFGLASELKLNTKKSVAVCLHPKGPNKKHADMVIKCQPRTEPTRHLGIQLASTISEAAVWTMTIKAIQQRLILVGQKTSDPFQRARLARANGVPKVLYVARHVWPSARTISALEAAFHHFTWTGDFSVRHSEERRATMNKKLS